MKTMTYLLSLTLLFVSTQVVYAENTNDGEKQKYISFENSQAMLPDKEYYEPEYSDSNPGVNRDAPDWEDDPGAYEFVSLIGGALVLDQGIQLGDQGDMLAAFDDDGNVRGVGIELSPPFGPYMGTPVWEVMIRSNEAGDVISFKYYDASEDAILDISETLVFVINEVNGDVITPIILNIGAPDLSCPECVDDDAALAPVGGCAQAVSMFGCDFVWGGASLNDLCPSSCGTCLEEDECGVCEGDGSSCVDCAGVPGGDSFIDCAGGCVAGWLMAGQGDGWCDDGTWGVVLECADFNCDDGDCGTELLEDGTCGVNCASGVFDCAGVCDGDAFEDCQGQCAAGSYADWIGDGYCDGTDMTWGLDLSCFDCDGGDCSDECGVCEGSGIADGACDCNGNVDSGCGCGEPGPSGCDNTCGSTLEEDACGVCGGDGSDDQGCGCFEPGPSGCDNTCGSTLVIDDCGVCGGENSCYMSGDLNQDQILDVLDVVFLTEWILTNGNSTQPCNEICLANADYYYDGIINIQDVVGMVEEILITPPRTNDATEATIMKYENTLSLQSNGFVGGVQMTLEHGNDFDLTFFEDAFMSKHYTENNITKLMVIHPGENLFIANDDFTISEVIVVSSDEYVSTQIIENMEYSITAAYPNPFNPVTNISYTVPVESSVTLSIFDMQGRRVTELVNEYHGSGIYNASWNADGYPTGVYFVQLTSGSLRTTKKLMLIK